MTRKTYEIDGMRYDVVRADLHPELGNKRRWELRLTGRPGVPEAKVYLDPSATIEDAARRLLGPDAQEV